jgi:hypothetical protein
MGMAAHVLPPVTLAIIKLSICRRVWTGRCESASQPVRARSSFTSKATAKQVGADFVVLDCLWCMNGPYANVLQLVGCMHVSRMCLSAVQQSCGHDREAPVLELVCMHACILQRQGIPLVGY